MSKITSVDELRRLYKAPSARAVGKELSRLDVHCRRFVELSPFVVVASSGSSGPADASPRGGQPGFVRCVDDRTLAMPDFPGNNRLDTMSNLLANPEIALMFMIPGVDEVLRVNGTAEIRGDDALRESFRVGQRPPSIVLLVKVRQAFLHCAKAVMRARLWDEDAKIERSRLPSLGQMLKDQIGSPGEVETQEEMVARYEAGLY